MAKPAMYISHPIPVKPSVKIKGKSPMCTMESVPWKDRLQNRGERVRQRECEKKTPESLPRQKLCPLVASAKP